MGELDIEALKQRIPKGIHILQETGVVLTVPQSQAIITALEDRDRLRARVERLQAGLIKCRDALRTCAEGHRAIDWFAALENIDD